MLTTPREKTLWTPSELRRTHRAPSRRRWTRGRLIILVVVAGLVTISCSYMRALTYPGEASLSVRTVEWLRDNGGAPLVDAVENWWFTRHAPSTARPRPTSLPRSAPPVPGAPPALAQLGGHAADGEGIWRAGPVQPDGTLPMLHTWLLPDPAHPGVLAAVARFDQRLVRARLIAGTREPDRQQWPEGGQVPPADRASLVATFNSGFKMAGALGGYFADGHLASPLRDGSASLVIDREGQVSIDQWGRDRRMGPDIAAVRQNLALIVDGGAIVPGLDGNATGRWGSAKNQLQYTWRSGLGIDRSGALAYVAGNDLTLATLARALADTGAVRGMELDIHPQEVHLFTYRHPSGTPDPVPSALLHQMRGPRDRYLQADQRDFIALLSR